MFITRELGTGTKIAFVLLFIRCLSMYVPVSVCLHGGGGQRTILGVTSQELSILFFETGSLMACELGSAGLAEDPSVCVSPTPGLQVHPTTLSFLQRCWGFNRGPYVCKVSTFLTEPFLWLRLHFQISLSPVWAGAQFAHSQNCT